MVEGLTRDDWHVFRLYGRAMLSVQLLELSIFQLAQLSKKEERRPEVALKRIDGLLKQPAKDQAAGLNMLPAELRSDLREAINLRNKLAHDFLLEYRLKAHVDNDALTWARELLTAAQELFDGLVQQLDIHAKAAHVARGIPDPPLSNDELEDSEDSLREWSQDLDS